MPAKVIAEAARFDFIEGYLRDRTSSAGLASVDILDRYFVDAYVEHTGALCAVMPFGANKCKLLSQDLRRMQWHRRLTRTRTGIEGLAGMGFPRWVYTYKLSK